MARIRDSTKVFGKSCCVPLPCSRVLLFLYWMSHTVLQTASVLRLSIPVCHESHSLKCDCAGHAGPTSAKGSLKWAYETRVKCTNVTLHVNLRATECSALVPGKDQRITGHSWKVVCSSRQGDPPVKHTTSQMQLAILEEKRWLWKDDPRE